MTACENITFIVISNEVSQVDMTFTPFYRDHFTSRAQNDAVFVLCAEYTENCAIEKAKKTWICKQVLRRYFT